MNLEKLELREEENYTLIFDKGSNYQFNPSQIKTPFNVND